MEFEILFLGCLQERSKYKQVKRFEDLSRSSEVRSGKCLEKEKSGRTQTPLVPGSSNLPGQLLNNGEQDFLTTNFGGAEFGFSSQANSKSVAAFESNLRKRLHRNPTCLLSFLSAGSFVP